MTRAPLAALIVAAVLAPAPAAQAAVVTATPRPATCPRGCVDELLVRFEAAPGERNDITVDHGYDDITLRDDGAEIRVEGSGCRAVDPHTVACAVMGRVDLGVATGDEADHVRANGPPFYDRVYVLGPGDDTGEGPGMSGGEGDDRLLGNDLEGGPGNDSLTVPDSGAGDDYERSHADGGPGDDRLSGGARPDSLYGGGGRDELAGGAGNDVLSDGDLGDPEGGGARHPVDADVLDGGAGVDLVSYTARTAPVTVDLRREEGAGQAGEGDRLSGFEAATGGAGDDVLVGTAAIDRLDGAAGRDRVVGGPGDDDVRGGEGRDVVLGGAGRDNVEGGGGADGLAGGGARDRVAGGGGDDRIRGGDGPDRLLGGEGVDVVEGGAGADHLFGSDDYVRDVLRCGTGRDVAALTRGDRARACERHDRRPLLPLLGGGERRPRLEVHRGRVLVELCIEEHPYDCRGTVVLRVGGRTVARRDFACERDPEVACGLDVAELRLRLPRALVRRVLREGRVAAETVIALGPGLGRGGIPVVERVWLVRPGG
jgi:Ca2+-binding RTX toxin-like protein